jgi:predicted Zn-dependent protease
MIILHEYLDQDIGIISKEIAKTFDVHPMIVNTDFGDIFKPTKNWKGFLHSDEELLSFVKKYHGLKSIIFTPRDLYIDDKSHEDGWIFGYSVDKFSVVTTARMKRFDNKPSKEVFVPRNKYLDRVINMAIHEIGHDVVKGNHLLSAKWVSLKNNYSFELGSHCTDNKCVLYEVVDITTPPKEEGHMLLGEEKVYDTGLDELLERRYANYFCKKCRDSIVLDKGYF